MERVAPFEKMALGAAAPGAHEVVVESRGEPRAQDGDGAREPFFSDLRAHFHGDRVGDARQDALGRLPLHEVAREIEAGGAGGGHPQGGDFVVGRIFEAVDQAELLEHADGNGRENAHVRKERGEPADAQAHSFERAGARGGPYDARGRAIEQIFVERTHVLPGLDRQAIDAARVAKIFFRIELHPVIGVPQSSADERLQQMGKPCPAGVFSHLLLDAGTRPKAVADIICAHFIKVRPPFSFEQGAGDSPCSSMGAKETISM